MKNINILISVNKAFFEHVQELIFSVLYYSKKDVNIYMMYNSKELGMKDINEMKAFVENTRKGKLIALEFDETKLEGMPTEDDEGDFFGIEAYSRLICSFLLPEEVDKILYLDADMICTGDIEELYDIEFDGKTWIACEDEGIRPIDLERLGLPLDYHYINSGMLLINVNKLRKNYTEKKIIELIEENKEILIYPDQDFINKIFKDDIKIVNKKYNFIAKDAEYKEIKEKPLIIHYAGSVKPWQENVSRFEKEYIEEYYKILELQSNKKEKLKQLRKKHEQYGYKNN